MRTTSTSTTGRLPRHPSSTGPVAATWVAGTGAFLLVAAAAVFIAVQWDRLPEVAKLALVGALTGAFLAGGRLLRRSLPATGDVLFHLGAFLLPVDLAGLGLRASVGWRPLLVAEGVLGVAVLGGLGAASGSVVLAWAAAASMVVLALGVAAVSPLPAVVPLAAAAVAAHLAGRRRAALAWSTLAVLAPVVGFAASAVVEGSMAPGAGVLADLGAEGGLVALTGCLAGAVVLSREARARHDLALAAVAVAGFVAALVTTWAGAGIPGRTTLLALPAAFLAVEVAAVLCRRDPFWRPLAAGGATVAEGLAGAVGGVWTAGLVLAAPIVETGLDLMSDVPGWEPQPAEGAALAILAVAWLVAGERRNPGGHGAPAPAGTARAVLANPWTAALAALAAVAAVEVATASGPAASAALVAVAAALVWGRRPAAVMVGAGLAVWAPVAVTNHPALALAAGMAGTTVCALAAASAGAAGPRTSPSAGFSAAAVWRARPLDLGTSPAAALWRARALAVVLTLAALAAAAAGAGLATPALGGTGALAAFVVQAWMVATLLHPLDPMAAHLARAGMVSGVAVALTAPVGVGVPASVVATALLAGDAVRLGRPRIGMAAGATLQVAVALLAGMAGFDVAGTGLVLVLGAVVWGGLAAVVEGDWREPFVAAAGLGMAAGLLLATADPVVLADAMIVSGGLVIAAGVVGGNRAMAHAGGAAATLGVLGHLDAANVIALEPYVAPVALHLVVAGWSARRSGRLSSWVAYGPAIALLGASALAERLAGGPAWHSLVAGAVGVAAVATGGWQRLAGPLFLGTGLLVAVTLNESLGALAGVPTWGWLAAGGCLLLAVGVALERADASPAEAGRRLVDVISERFE